MRFFTFFTIYLIFFGIFYWVIRKINLRIRLFNMLKKINIKYAEGTLILVLILSTFFIKYEKQLLNDIYGNGNYISIILDAISFNLILLIFDKGSKH